MKENKYPFSLSARDALTISQAMNELIDRDPFTEVMYRIYYASKHGLFGVSVCLQKENVEDINVLIKEIEEKGFSVLLFSSGLEEDENWHLTISWHPLHIKTEYTQRTHTTQEPS